MPSEPRDSIQPEQSTRIEAILRKHPGVRAAKVAGDDLKRGPVTAYIIPDEDYLANFSADIEEERKRIQTWRKTFDLMQMGKEAASAELGFNIAGWNSSYTRQPIPPSEMREWVANTVAEISAFGPKDVLEIGCGTGLLLLRISPQCQSYRATDFAPAVLGKLRKQLEELPGSWNGVTLLERSADNFDGMDEDSFDTVIINSVVQHFPNVSYLVRVLQGAARVLKPGGRIFVGDVRSLPLLEAYAISVELYQAAPETMLTELHERAQRRLRQQDQLVISPAFFLAFGEQNPKISDVEVRIKRGRSDNELTRYRYSAVLYARSRQPRKIELEWREWKTLERGRADIEQMLKDKTRDTIAISQIPNARLEQDLNAIARLSEGNGHATTGQLKEELRALKPKGIDPEDLYEDAERADYQLQLSWARCAADGSFDAVFSRKGRNKENSCHADWPQPSPAGVDFARLTNVPGRNALRQRFARALEAYCEQQAPDNVMPCTVELVDSLPETGHR